MASLFGLFGSDERSEDESEDGVAGASPVEDGTSQSNTVEDGTSQHDSETATVEDPETKRLKEKLNKSKWRGVYEEYDTSSFLHHFTKDNLEESDDTNHAQSMRVVDEDTATESDIALVDAQAKHSSDCEEQAGREKSAKRNSAHLFVSREECAQILGHTLDNERSRSARQRLEEEQAARRLLEDAQRIQQEVEQERNQWQPLYSDEEEDGGIELKERVRKKQKIVIPSNSSSAGEGPQFLPGERWKRLQIIAETKVKSNPEKYNSIPIYHFPLKD